MHLRAIAMLRNIGDAQAVEALTAVLQDKDREPLLRSRDR